MRRPRSFFSGEAFFVKPTGSQRSSGTGCGILNWSPAAPLSEKNSRKPTKRTICHLPASGTWSQSSAGDAAVLDLGVAQPADRVLVATPPEVRVGEAEGVVEADDRVELDGERLKVGLGLLDLDRGAGGRRSDERRGDREAGESDGELHFDDGLAC